MKALVNSLCVSLVLGIAAPCFVAADSEFQTQADLAAWSALEVTNWDDQAFGSRTIVPDQGGVLRVVADYGTWYQASTGGLLWQLRDGDFVVSTRLLVYGAEGPLPNGNFELAGLMVRQPGTPSREKAENWEYLVTGGDFGERIVDYKTTRNTLSTWKTEEVEGSWVELKLARLGDRMVKFWRPDGGTWRWAETQIRPDLVGPMEVGLCFLTNFIGESDLRVDIDWVRWSTPPRLPTSEPAYADQWQTLFAKS